MTIVEVILKIVSVLLEIWKNREDPTLAKTRAAAVLTKELNDDVESFDKALKENDSNAISAHFELLHRRVSQAAPGSSGGAIRQADKATRE